MKTLITVLLGLSALVWATPVHQPTVADKEFLTKQQKVLTLFYHINQPSYYEEHQQIVNTFKVEKHTEQFKKPELVKQLFQVYEYGMLPKGEIFSVTYDKHLEEAILLFKLFYYANDFDTFYKTAVVARQHVNEGLFLYAFSVAIIHRPDTYGIILPPIYEIYPHYFFPTEVIHEAYKIKQMYHGEQDEHTHQGHSEHEKFHGYTLYANYSGHYLNLDPEQSMSYYLEDVGLNSFFYYYHLHYPFWMDGVEFGLKHDYRGDMYYFVMHQLVARYYLERLSNHKGEIPMVFLEDGFIATPYYPSLEYPNGLEFPSRPQFARIQQYFVNHGQSIRNKIALGMEFVSDYDRRINDAIDRGFAFTHEGKKVDLFSEEDGLNILGNMIQANPDSPDPHFYGPWQKYAHHLLGYSQSPLDAYKVVPSALEHFETALRDPVFYQLYKQIVLKFQRYFAQYPAYTKKDLTFAGVKIDKFEVDRLVTYFDHFYSDISYAVFDSEEELKEDKFSVRAHQYRLNHKPFTYKIQIKSDSDQQAVVKVFLGPKVDEYGRPLNISVNRLNFVVLDKFVYDLKAGTNTVKRNSMESIMFGADKMGDKELFDKVQQALKGQDEFTLDGSQNYFKFPQRLMLPKGSHSGFPYQFYVIVYPYVPYKNQHAVDGQSKVLNYPRPGTGGPYIDQQFLGYPFDRPIKYEQLFNEIPNAVFHEARIYHRNVEDINASHTVVEDAH